LSFRRRGAHEDGQNYQDSEDKGTTTTPDKHGYLPGTPKRTALLNLFLDTERYSECLWVLLPVASAVGESAVSLVDGIRPSCFSRHKSFRIDAKLLQSRCEVKTFLLKGDWAAGYKHIRRQADVLCSKHSPTEMLYRGENHSSRSYMTTRREPKAHPPEPGSSLRLDALSEKRRQIIRPVLESPREFVLLNVRSMADRLATAPATIVRIVQSLGFESYRSFQHYLHDLSITSSTILDNMQSAGNTPRTPKYLKGSRKQIEENLSAVTNQVDLQQVLDIAVRIHKAKRILVLGGDMASILVEYMEYHLTIAGLPVISAVNPGRASHLVRSLDAEDIAIGISFRRGLRMTIEGIQNARKKGAYCVGITDTVLSPLARFSDELLLVPVSSLSFAASYVAPIALIDLITAGVGNLRRQQVVERLKEADQEQKHGYRWYQAES
jgi:DNA-binding MurR/RpiR family transcriptional regulator